MAYMTNGSYTITNIDMTGLTTSTHTISLNNNSEQVEIISSSKIGDFCDIEECKMKDSSTRNGLIISVGDQKVPASCLLCVHLKRKEMNVEFQVQDTIKALSK